MVILINGTLGVGKTETSWRLLELFGKAVMLDGDYIGAVHPFEIYDVERERYLYQTLLHLIRFHRESGYANFVINYVFEDPLTLSGFRAQLDALDGRVFIFRLVASDEEVARRIQCRTTQPEQLQKELKRYRELIEIQEKASQRGDLGQVVDTTGKSVDEVAREIWKRIQSPPPIP